MSKFTTLVKPEELAAHLNDPDWVIVDCRHDLADTEAGARAFAGSQIPGARVAQLDKDHSGPRVPGKKGGHPLPEIDQG
ncbi:MAG TPA: rhodanese-like domain-containing protein, partial [Flavilitoribacter sp.]|nr:rhodanese-like domain-containing protein [Flavilitoribacter sp.]